MTLWVQQNNEIYELLSSYEPSYQVEEPDQVFLDIHQALIRSDSPEPIVTLQDDTLNYYKIKVKRKERSSERKTPKPPFRNKSANLIKRPTSNIDRLIRTQFKRPTKVEVLEHPQTRARNRRQIKLTKEKVFELKKVFDRIDINSSGRIEAEEFMKSLASSFDKSDSLFNYFDIYKTGFISFEEFLIHAFSGVSQQELTTMLKWVISREKQMRMDVNTGRVKKARVPKRKVTANTEADYRFLFRVHDKNQDGFLDFDELNEAIGNVLANGRVEALMEQYGTNGKVDFKAFLRIMLPNDIEVSGSIEISATH